MLHIGITNPRYVTVYEHIQAFVRRMRGAYRTRTALRRLADLDDRMLTDIGLTREELQGPGGLPLEMNGSQALSRRR